MNRTVLALATALMIGSIASAQTPPTPTDAPSNAASPTRSPSSSMNNSSTTGTANYSNGSGDDKWQMKSCLEKQKTDNPNITKAEMKRNCAKLKPASGQ
jgi:hypothetical protein